MLRLNATTAAPRHEVLFRLQDELPGVASIVDFHQFSGVSICLNLELPRRNVPELLALLERLELAVDPDGIDAANGEEEEVHSGLTPEPAEEVEGTLQITFANGDPDARVAVPVVPG